MKMNPIRLYRRFAVIAVGLLLVGLLPGTVMAAADHLAITGSATPQAGTPTSYTVQALDASEVKDTSYSSSVTITNSDGAALFTTPQPLTSGTVTFSVTFETAGAQTLGASDGVLIAASKPVTVDPGALDHFTIATISTQTAGAAFDVTATAKDFYDNTITDYSGTPILTDDFSGSGANAPIDGSFGLFDDGVGTASGTIDFTAESNRIVTVTDGLAHGLSNMFTVDPGPLHDFVITTIPAQTAGIAFNVHATAKDQYGNTDTSYTGTPILSNTFTGTGTNTPIPGAFTAFSGGAGTASGTTDFTAQNGVTVTVTGSSKTGTSNAFNVGPAGADHFVIAAISSQTAGSPFAVTATAKDPYGNTDTSYTGTPTLTNNFSSTGGAPVAGTFTAFSGGVGTSSGTTDFTAQTLRTVTVTSGLVTGTSNTFTVNPGALNHFVVNAIATQTAGAPFAVTATAKDTWGNTVTGYTGTPTLTNNFSSTGGAPVAGTFTAFSGGVGTSSGTTDFTAETLRTVTVTDGLAVGTSAAFTVNPGALNHFVLNAIATQIAGAPFAVTATAKDTWGNTVTSYTGTPTLTNNFTINTTFPAVAGIFTAFSGGIGTSSGTTDFTAETLRTVTVTDGLAVGTSAAFSVTFGTINHFVISTVGPQTAGAPFSVTAAAVDTWGNTVTTYIGTPTLTNNFTGTGSNTPVPGTFPAFVGGVGTSSGTTDFTAQGLRTVTVTDGLLTGTSNTFTVNPAGVVTRFVLSGLTAATAGVPASLTVTAEDGFGNTATGYTGSIHFTSTDIQAVLPANSTLTPGTGTGTFSVTLKTAGSMSITATDTLNATLTGTQSGIVVSPGPLHHFAINYVATQTAGVAFGVIATAKDAYNNTVTAYTGTPVLTNNFSSTGGAPVAGTFGAFVAGVRTSSGTKDFTAETGRTVTVTDTGSGKLGTSNAFAVNPAAASKLVVSGPATATLGAAKTYTVTAKDSFNNTAISYSGTVTITSSDAHFVSSPASHALTHGVGNFSVTFHTSGNQTLGAHDSSMTATVLSVLVSLTGVKGSTYHVMLPTRVLDTRSALGHTGKLAANTPITFAVAGRLGIPAGATAVTGNVTVVNSTFGWAIFLGPIATASPTTSTINFTAGQVTGNGLTVALSPTGTLSATYLSSAGNKTDLVFDVTGYFTADVSGATYHPMTPIRSLDTRVGKGIAGKLVANKPQTWKVAGNNGVPSNAVAVTGNVTVVNSTYAWAVYLGPNPLASPTTSTINFNAGEIKGNSLTVSLSGTGSLSATYMSSAGNTTDLVFDVTGYYTQDSSGGKFVALTPTRLLDTRTGNGLTGSKPKPITAGQAPLTFQVTGRGAVQTQAIGVTGNVTVVGETSGWAIFVGPTPTPNPTTSTINFQYGDVKGNGLTVALSGTGTLSATYMSIPGQTTQLVFDVTGYFVP